MRNAITSEPVGRPTSDAHASGGVPVNARENAPAAGPAAMLYRLLRQLRILVPVLTVSPNRPETRAMLTGLNDTATQAAPLLTVADPAVLTAIRTGLDHAHHSRHNEACTELVAAHGRLAVLLRQDKPRRPDAAHEPTLRWRLEP